MIRFLKNIIAEYKRHRAINATIKELNSLTNKELNDIGLARGDIYDVAHSSFPKKNEIVEDTYKIVPVNVNLRGAV